MKHFALAGNPNCGKTTLFNALTGSTAHVGNWPGVTVDKREGTYKHCAQPVDIVDLPGIYSLSPYTPEEVIARNYILDEGPDCVINIVDATNLDRNLYLTTQLMEIDVPIVVALNMMDAVEKAGDSIDADKLSRLLGLPVVPISALKETGLDRLMQVAYEASQQPRTGTTVLSGTALMHLIGDCKIALEGQGVANALFHAIKLVEMDELEVAMHPTSAAMVQEFKRTFSDDTFGNDFEAIVADTRYRYIAAHFSQALTRGRGHEKSRASRSDRADRILTHRVWGIPIFLVILFLVFHLTFAEDFLFFSHSGAFDAPAPVVYDIDGHVVNAPVDGAVYYDADGHEVEAVVEDGELVEANLVPYAYDSAGQAIATFYDAAGRPLDVLVDADGELVDLYSIDGVRYDQIYTIDGYRANIVVDVDGRFAAVEFASAIDEFCADVSVYTFFGYEESIYSPGVILFNTMETFTGFLSACVSQAMADVTPWVSGLVVDGVLGGLFSVLSFVPQILLLFFFFSLLEDSGYMARVAFILDRIFRRFGLSGRAFMPMIMGFGCSVPAMINTRTLADEKERTATIRVIPFFSCGAKLPILTAVAGAMATTFGLGSADLITYGMYLLGMLVAVAAVILMRHTTMKGETPPFIMELPAYHIPGFKNLMAHLWDKTKHFVKKAFTIILASTIVIWLVSHFSWSWHFVPDEQINLSILAGIGQLVQPLFTPMGFGSQLGAYGWVFVVAAVTGLIAKENVIATFGTLGACVSGAIIDVEADGGIAAVQAMIAATGINQAALIAFIAFNMLTIPCFAAVATAKAELPGRRAYLGTLAFWIATSYIVGTMVYLVGTWWWTVFIFAALWAAVITLIALQNKGIIRLPHRVKATEGAQRTPIGCVGCPMRDSCSGAACPTQGKKKNCCD